jgi:hypothetical protein
MMFGFPSNPSAQEQMARCDFTMHSAFVPQLQGFLHCELMQASESEHSESLTHPGLTGGIICLHSPLLSGTQFSGQEQIIVRTGKVSRTSHLAERAHGERAVQGFLHVLSMQAIFEGQSLSILQSGSISRAGASQYEKGLPRGIASGHLHFVLWFDTKQIALLAQGFLSRHGFIQCLFSQAWSWGQSKSE